MKQPQPVHVDKDAPDVTPKKNRLLVRAYPPPEETTTAGGIVVSRRARESEVETGIRGRVIRVGKDCDPDFVPGQWILFPRFTGTAVIHNRLGDPDFNYVIIAEDVVMAEMSDALARQQLGLDSATGHKLAAV